MTQPPHPVSPVHPGDVLAGKYQVERVLGVGGMGVVVAAKHLQLEERVALKFMLEVALTAPDAVARFLREARAAARLKSEHVAKVTDVGTLENGAPYMVMEYLDGQDLSQIVEASGRLEVEVAVDYVLQACEALAEAHSVGIVHRDLKPANLFLARRADGGGTVKVLDFGISKVTGTGPDLGMTKTSSVMGSPLYMSPEQMKSAKDVDARSDIWALGVILYELLSGEIPFEADTMAMLIALVLSEPPTPLASRRPDLPRELIDVVNRCLEKSPAARFGSVGELAIALAPLASHRGHISVERVLATLGHAPVPRETMTSGSGRQHAQTQGSSLVMSSPNVGPPRSVMPVFIGLGVLALLLGVGGYFVANVKAPEAPPLKVPTSPAAKITASPDPPSTASPSQTAAVDVTPVTAPPPSASAAPETSTRVPKGVNPPPATTPKRPPPIKPPSDDDAFGGRR